MKIKNGRYWLAVGAWLFLAASSHAAIMYKVTVDTSSVSGTTGYLDFQFNPNNPTSQAAVASITGFTGGTLGAVVPPLDPNITGTLPALMTMNNSAALVEAYQVFTYGPSFSFFVALSGPAIDTPNGTATAGTTFGLGLYDSSSVAILTSNFNGFAFQAQINLLGNPARVTPTAFPNGANPTVVTFAEVPEPGAMGLAGLGLAALFLVKRRLT